MQTFTHPPSPIIPINFHIYRVYTFIVIFNKIVCGLWCDTTNVLSFYIKSHVSIVNQFLQHPSFEYSSSSSWNEMHAHNMYKTTSVLILPCEQLHCIALKN